LELLVLSPADSQALKVREGKQMISNLFMVATFMIIIGSLLVLIFDRDEKTKYISREHQDFMRFYRAMKRIQEADNKAIKRKGKK
jgi:hypothetical protein